MLGFESNYVVKCRKTISHFLIRPVAKFQNLRCILPSDLFRGIPHGNDHAQGPFFRDQYGSERRRCDREADCRLWV